MEDQIKVYAENLQELQLSLKKFSEAANETIAQARKLIESESCKTTQGGDDHNQSRQDNQSQLQRITVESIEGYEHRSYYFEQLLSHEVPDAIYWLKKKHEAILVYLGLSIGSNATESRRDESGYDKDKSIAPDILEDAAMFLVNRWIGAVLPSAMVSLGPIGVGLNILGLSIHLPFFQLDLGGFDLALQPEFRIPFFSPEPSVELGVNIRLNREEPDAILLRAV